MKMRALRVLLHLAELLRIQWLRGGRISRAASEAWEENRRDPETQYRRIEAGRMRP